MNDKITSPELEERIRLYSGEFWSVSKDKDIQPPEIREWWQKEARYVLENVDRDADIIDIGCGEGRSITLLAPSANSVIGIDISEDALRKAGHYCKSFHNVTLLKCNILSNNRNLRPESFDYAIVTGNTFGNLGEPDDRKLAALLEMRRVLKLGGDIFLSVYAEESMHEPYFSDRIEWYRHIGILVKDVQGKKIYATDGLVTECFSPDDIYGLADQARMKVMDLKRLGPIAYMVRMSKDIF